MTYLINFVLAVLCIFLDLWGLSLASLHTLLHQDHQVAIIDASSLASEIFMDLTESRGWSQHLVETKSLQLKQRGSTHWLEVLNILNLHL